MSGFLLSAFAVARKTIRPVTGANNHRISLFVVGRKMSTSSDYYTIGITGSGGLVGTALIDELGRREQLFEKPIRIVRLTRGDHAETKMLPSQFQTTLTWNPHGSTADDIISPQAASEIDSIVHLSGENVSTNIGLGPLNVLGIRPWTQRKKDEIIHSRVSTTAALSKVVAASDKPKTFLSASGVGVYGDRFIGDTAPPAADESTDTSNVPGFLAHVSREWEAATDLAKNNDKQHRVVILRNAVVMSKQGGALQKLYPIFLLGGGGRIGGGRQYFTFISARDLARAFVYCLETPSLEGPVNMCAPIPCTNLEFTKAMGSVLHRPTILPLPSFAV